MTNLPKQPILLGQLNLKFRAPTKPHSNKSTAPTLKPLPVDRDPALRGAGLFAVAHGAWGLGAVTPDRGLWTGGRAAGSAELGIRPTVSRSKYRGPWSVIHCLVRL